MRYGREIVEKLEAATTLLQQAETLAKVDDRRVCKQLGGCVERVRAVKASMRSRIE